MTLIPNTFDGLVSASRALAEDPSQEFLDYVPTAVFLAEERLIRELDTQGVKTVVSTTLVQGDPYVTKPTGYRFGYDFSYRTSAGLIEVLNKTTNDYIRDYWPHQASVAQPKYYSDEDNTRFVVGPTPASAYNATLIYTKQFTHLSSGAQTNYYTDFCADALYYGTMSNLAEFMKDYTVQPIWEQKYLNAVQGLNNEGRRSRRDDSMVPSNPTGVQNTLKGDN